MRLDPPEYSNDYLHDAAAHIHKQKGKFAQWLENVDPIVVANALLVLCIRGQKILTAQMKSQLETFKETGGFSENMTADRLEAPKRQAVATGAPVCPRCGKPMLKRMQKRGQGQGQEFWGCSDYPQCRGFRNV